MNPLAAFVSAVTRRLHIAAWRITGRKFYICHLAHENDRVAARHLASYFHWAGVNVDIIEFNATGQRPELRRALGKDVIAVVGYNSQLDHSWIGDEKFIEMAAKQGIPVIQLILDHPSLRWPQFDLNRHASNVRYMFVSPFCEDYFRRYGDPNARTGVLNLPVDPCSRVEDLSRRAFMKRDIACLVPLNLRRLGGTAEEIGARMEALEPPLAEAVRKAIEQARFDLKYPLVRHLEAALARGGIELDNERMHVCAAMVEDMTHIWRRRRIFEVAARFPVLIQTDIAPRELTGTAVATFRTAPEWTNPKATITRMKSCRAVLSVSLTNDNLHDRMGNAISAGCVAVVEDNAIHRRVFTSGKNALLFRYDDNSLEKCLDLVCNDPEQAYRVARRGARLRDKSWFRFRGGSSLIRLALGEKSARAS